MRVRMLVEVSDEARGYGVGDLAEFPDEKAARWIKLGFAIAGTDDAPEATALAAAPERATLPPAKKRG